MLTLQSVYHSLQQLPCVSVIKDYPYSPRWNADEMAERIRYIYTILHSHKKICIYIHALYVVIRVLH